MLPIGGIQHNAKGQFLQGLRDGTRVYSAGVTPSLQDRIKAAAAVTGHSVDALLSHLADVVPALAEVEVATNAEVTAVGVSTRLVADAHLEQRMKNLANAISGSEALARSASARKAKVMRVERGIGPKGRPARGLAGVFSTVYHLEPRKVADDIAIAREIGIPPGACDQLAAQLGQLGIATTTMRVTVYAGTPVENVQIELGAPASADMLDRLDDTSEASRFLRALRPAFTSLLWLGATPTGLLPAARIEYLQPDLEEAVAIAGKFGEMNRAHSFVAALESSSIASIAVSLGTSPLGGAWLSANV